MIRSQLQIPGQLFEHSNKFDQRLDSKTYESSMTVETVDVESGSPVEVSEEENELRNSVTCKEFSYSVKCFLSLLDWIHNTGVESTSFISSKFNLEETDESRGIVVKESLKRNELLFKIPHSHLFNRRTILGEIKYYNDWRVKGATAARDLFKKSTKNVYFVGKMKPLDSIYTELYSYIDLTKLSSLSSFQLLSFYLTLEKKRGDLSFWVPFIKILPDISEFMDIPLMWLLGEEKDEELFQLLPSSARKHALRILEKFENDYNTITEVIDKAVATIKSKHADKLKFLTPTTLKASESFFSKEDFLYSWLCVNSRCLYMDLGLTAEDNFTMAPFVDFLNHSEVQQCKVKIDSLGFQVFTNEQFKPGQQIFFSYGPHSNEFLLNEYGFTLKKNKWNFIDITEEVQSLMNTYHVDYLKETGYYGEYSVNCQSISFRTEVALAAIQEDLRPTGSINERAARRRLGALIQGVGDGAYYKRTSNKLLKKLLEQIVFESESKMHLEYDAKNSRSRLVGQLHRERSELAKMYISRIDSNGDLRSE